MHDKITKAEYFREHAELLSSIAGSLNFNDKSRAPLVRMSHYFEALAEAAERETLARSRRVAAAARP